MTISCPMLLHSKISSLFAFKDFIKQYGWNISYTEGTGPQNMSRYTTGPKVAPSNLNKIKVNKNGEGCARLIIFATVEELDKFMQAAADDKWKLAFHGYEGSFVGFPVYTPYKTD